MGPLIQVVGALLVLAAFALAQARVVTQHARMYLVLNLVGSAVLAVDASVGRQWGFLLLEGVWAVISAWGLVKTLRWSAVVAARGRRWQTDRPGGRDETLAIGPRESAGHARPEPAAAQACGRVPAAPPRQSVAAPVGETASNRATHSTCAVCGNMSTGRTRSSR